MTNAQKLLMIGGAPWLTRRDYPKLVGGLEAWFDETDPSSMIMDSANRVSLIADKSGNSGVNCLVLNGVAGNYASSPSGAPNQPGDNFEIIWYGQLASWTAPAATQILMAKRSAAGAATTTFSFFIGAGTGFFALVISDGTSTATPTSNAAASFSDFQAGYIKATYERNTGGGNYAFKVYSSPDGVTYTQIGATQTGASIGATRAGTEVLEIGSQLTGTSLPLKGNCYYASLAKSVGGVPTTIFAPATASKLAPSFVASTGETWTINTSGATGARISGARDRYQGTAASQQVYLPWSGTNYGYLNGVSGNYYSSPDAAALDIVGSIDLRAQAASADWSNGTLQMLISKNTTIAGQYAYDFYIGTGGALTFRYSPDGTVLRSATSSTIIPTADRVTTWLRVTYNSATGDVMFYTSPDNSTWTQVGTTQVLTAGAIFAGTNAIAVGSNSGNSGGVNLFVGNIYRAQIYNGIAGTLAFDFNPAAYTSGTTFLDSSANAATITINGGAMIVTRPGLYSDGSDDYSKTPAFALSQPETVYFVGSQVTWTAFDFLFDGNTTDSMRTRQEGTTPGLIASAGSSSAENDDLAVGSRGIVTNVFNGANSVLRINRLSATTGNFGAANGNGFTLAARGAGDLAWGNITAQEVVVYSGAHDTATQDRVIRYLARKHRLPAV